MRPISLALLTAAVLTVPTSASALPDPTLRLTDKADPAAAYDIVAVTARSAPKEGRPAVVVVRHDRKVALGDNLEAWFDLDNDKVPDVHLSGSSFSEYVVRLATSFDAEDDGKDISGRDCVRLSMSGRDLARVGRLLLAGGVHEGRRVVPEDWIAAMRSPLRIPVVFGMFSSPASWRSSASTMPVKPRRRVGVPVLSGTASVLTRSVSLNDCPS